MRNMEKFESFMSISKENNRYKRINGRQTVSGSFYTRKMSWFSRPVRKFFEKHIKTTQYVLDPFAGRGDLLKNLAQQYEVICEGYDLLGGQWPINNSLVHIPNPNSALICTNPPYLAKHSAKRKGVFEKVQDYYTQHYDLYEVAIKKSMEMARAAIFIIPETFLHSSFPKTRLRAVSVITENPFTDTENPICVACFEIDRQDGESKAKVYIGDQYICPMSKLIRKTRYISRDKKISFNNPSGNIALKAVDGTNPNDRIRFEKSENFYYGKEKIKHSSRLLTYIHIEGLRDNKIENFLKQLNKKLEEKRKETADLILSPFKGNNKAGKRRRRLDYALARNLIIQSLNQ